MVVAMGSKMSIDEVDEILALKEELPSKASAYIVLGFTILFWVTGGFFIAMFLQGAAPAMAGVVQSLAGLVLRWDVMLIIIIVFIVMLFAAFLYLYLVYKFAREILMGLYLLLGLGLLGLGGLLAYINPDAMIVGIIFAICGFVVLVLFLIFKERISLAGRMIELSAKAVWDEKGTMSLIVVKALLIAWTVVTWVISLVFWTFTTYAMLEGFEYQGVVALVVGLILFFAGLWSLTFLDTFFNAAIVRIIHDWYRSPEVDVASVKKGLKKAWEVSGSLAKYAFIFALLSFIIHLARSYSRRGRGRGAIAARIVAWVTGFTQDVLKFLGFYMIPAMVIRRVGFKTAFRDSIHKLRDLFVETLAGMYGFEIVLGFLAFITAGSMGIIW